MVGDLTLAENLVLGVEPTRRGVLDAAAIDAATAELETASGWRLPWDHPAADVGVADLGRFELLRQLHRGSDILILDEPTAVLGPADTDQLLATMTDLRDAGSTIMSHHPQARRGAPRRRRRDRPQGRARSCGRARPRPPTRPSLARAMVGEALAASPVEAARAPGETILETSGLTVRRRARRRPARRRRPHRAVGEIVAVYGVAGSGQRPARRGDHRPRPGRRGRSPRRSGHLRPAPGGAPPRRPLLHLPRPPQRGPRPRRADPRQRDRRPATPAGSSPATA